MKVIGKMLKLVGEVFFFVGIAGGILGSFDFVLVIRGHELPTIDWTTGIICALIGLGLFSIGYLIQKKYGNIDAIVDEKPTLNMSDLGFVVKALKKTRRRNFNMGIFMSLFGLGMILLPLQSSEGAGVTIGLAIFGAICLLIGIMSFVQYNKLKNIETSEIYRLIMHTPQQITGLTAQVFRSGFGKVGQAINANIIVGKKTKGVLSITENDLELLRQYLVKHNPGLELNKTVQQA